MAMSKRKIVEELTQRKIAMTAAIWSNNSWDKSEEANRQEAIEELEENFSHTVLMIYGQASPHESDEEEIDYENNPFFAAAKRGMDKIVLPEGTEEATTKQMINDAYDSMNLDQ